MHSDNNMQDIRQKQSFGSETDILKGIFIDLIKWYILSIGVLCSISIIFYIFVNHPVLNPNGIILS